MRRRLASLMLSGLIAVTALGATTVAGSKLHIPALAPVTASAGYCWNYGCDRGDSTHYYCVNNTVADSFDTYDRYSNHLAHTNLIWSYDCAANWVEIYSDFNRELYAELDRDNGDITWLDVWGTYGKSLMLGGLSNFLRGCSQVRDNQGNWTPFRCTGWH